jgi:exodeoxyribonuclease VII small subunit
MSRKTSSDTGSSTSTDPSPVADFEHSLDALEQLVEKMENGQMSLEDSLAAYERGVGLYRRCQQALEQAELRVRLLSDPEHPEVSEPFGDDTQRNDG